jgi:hypothetical protein
LIQTLTYIYILRNNKYIPFSYGTKKKIDIFWFAHQKKKKKRAKLVMATDATSYEKNKLFIFIYLLLLFFFSPESFKISVCNHNHPMRFNRNPFLFFIE